jgi:hypothetical protein
LPAVRVSRVKSALAMGAECRGAARRKSRREADSLLDRVFDGALGPLLLHFAKRGGAAGRSGDSPRQGPRRVEGATERMVEVRENRGGDENPWDLVMIGVE